MITSAFLYFVGYVFYSIVLLLPVSTTFPAQIDAAMTWVFTQSYAWNWLIPIDTIVLVLSYTAAFYTGLFTFYALRFIMNIIRGSGA